MRRSLVARVRAPPRSSISTAPSPAHSPVIPLGASSLRVSPIGLGTWQWGDTKFWGYGSQFTRDDCEAAYRVSRARGINFIDTAELYHSEPIIGDFLQDDNYRASVVLASKYAPWPTRLRSRNVEIALQASLSRLRVSKLDLYQVHWPWAPFGFAPLMNALADQVEAGRVEAIGVSNFNPQQTEAAHALLAKRGLSLASNQVEYNLLNRKAETSGLLKLCADLNIALISYSPLAQGVLSGKYHDSSTPRPQGVRGLIGGFKPATLAATAPLIALLRDISVAHSRSPSQVALNWLTRRGTIPIPGAKTAAQAEENAGALGWTLSDDEVAKLDAMSAKVAK